MRITHENEEDAPQHADDPEHNRYSRHCFHSTPSCNRYQGKAVGEAHPTKEESRLLPARATGGCAYRIVSSQL